MSDDHIVLFMDGLVTDFLLKIDQLRVGQSQFFTADYPPRISLRGFFVDVLCPILNFKKKTFFVHFKICHKMENRFYFLHELSTSRL